MMKLLYLHAFSSSGASPTGRLLSELLPNCKLIAPDLPEYPDPSIRLIEDICSEEHPDLICGSSMGGMLAQRLRGYPKILINPAFHVSEVINQYMGMKVYYYRPRVNKEEKEIFITKELQEAFKKVEADQFEEITPYDIDHTVGIFASNDHIVQGEEEYLKYYSHSRTYEGDHIIHPDAVREIVYPEACRLLGLSK